MYDAQFHVQVQDGIDQLLHDHCCLVLLQKPVLLGVAEQVALGAYLGYDVDVRLGFELVDELDDVGVVALF